MKIEGTHLFDAPREVVWRALLDPRVIACSLPGCEELKQVEENHFQGTIQAKVGPVQGQFQGSVYLSELNPPESYHLKLDGRGASGFLQGEGLIRLEEQNGSTRLQYSINAQIGGRIAAVGQRLLDSSARVITRQGLEQLSRQVEALQGHRGAETAADAPEGPSQAQFATRVARGVAVDLAGSVPLWVKCAIAATLGGIIVLVLRACI